MFLERKHKFVDSNSASKIVSLVSCPATICVLRVLNRNPFFEENPGLVHRYVAITANFSQVAEHLSVDAEWCRDLIKRESSFDPMNALSLTFHGRLVHVYTVLDLR
jgi:hypothetical protein